MEVFSYNLINPDNVNNRGRDSMNGVITNTIVGRQPYQHYLRQGYTAELSCQWLLDCHN